MEEWHWTFFWGNWLVLCVSSLSLIGNKHVNIFKLYLLVVSHCISFSECKHSVISKLMIAFNFLIWFVLCHVSMLSFIHIVRLFWIIWIWKSEVGKTIISVKIDSMESSNMSCLSAYMLVVIWVCWWLTT